jgi:hypothetical protein
MNKWILRFPVTLLIVLILGLVPTAFALEPTADLALTKTASIAESATFDPNPNNNTASLSLHILGNTH